MYSWCYEFLKVGTFFWLTRYDTHLLFTKILHIAYKQDLLLISLPVSDFPIQYKTISMIIKTRTYVMIQRIIGNLFADINLRPSMIAAAKEQKVTSESKKLQKFGGMWNKKNVANVQKQMLTCQA